jgi:hypothetical protein
MGFRGALGGAGISWFDITCLMVEDGAGGAMRNDHSGMKRRGLKKKVS